MLLNEGVMKPLEYFVIPVVAREPSENSITIMKNTFSVVIHVTSN